MQGIEEHHRPQRTIWGIYRHTPQYDRKEQRSLLIHTSAADSSKCANHTSMIRHQLLPFWGNLNRHWKMFMQRCFCSKFSNFRVIFAAAPLMNKSFVKIAWYEANDMPTLSANSLLVIWLLSKIILLIHCFNIFIDGWRAQVTITSIVTDIFTAFLKSIIPQLNM